MIDRPSRTEILERKFGARLSTELPHFIPLLAVAEAGSDMLAAASLPWATNEVQWSEHARRDLVECLLCRLHAVSAAVLDAESCANDRSERLRHKEREQLIGEYPVLGRLWSITVEQWVKDSSHLVRRLAADAGPLASLLSLQQPLELTRVSMPLSDLHDHGQSVRRIDFAGGESIMYKPRPLSLEQIYYGLFQVIDGCSRLFPVILERDRYGWMAAKEPPTQHTPSPGYMKSLGQHLALLFILGGSDVHAENMLTVDGRACPIDLECLLDYDFGQPESAAEQLLRIGILPGSCVNKIGPDAFDVSVLATANRRERDGSSCLVPDSLLSCPPGVAQHTIGGFRALHQVAGGCSDDIRRAVSRMEQMEVRRTVRPTWVYKDLISRSLEPVHLKSGFLWSLCFERLYRAVVNRDSGTRWFVCGQEIASMHRLDVPKLMFHPSRRYWREAGSERTNLVQGGLDNTAVNAVESRLLASTQASCVEAIRSLLAD